MEKANGDILKAKPCFEHLGGTLGCRLFQRLLELGWFELAADGTRNFALTETWKLEFEKLGVDIYDNGRQRRPPAGIS